jgi:transposase
MTKMTDDTIGIDVSKATLDVHRLSDGKMTSFSNDTAGFKLLYCESLITRLLD